jgi:hypothetical protein
METSFSPSLYYRHSGKFSISGILVATGFGLLVGLPCAFLYSYLIRWNPFIYINLLAALGFGAIIGVVVDRSLKQHKCRNVFITGLVAFVAVLVAYYLSWAVWLHAVSGAPVLDLLQAPIAMWNFMLAVNEVGTWSLKGGVVNGIPLWIVWATEAGCIIGLAVYIAVVSIQDSVYCESCDRFATSSKGVCVAGAGTAPPAKDKAALKAYRAGLKPQAAELKQHLEVKDFSYVEKLGSLQPDAIAWYSLDVASCPQCNITNTLSAKQVQRTMQGKKEKVTERTVLHNLLLSSTEADSIRKLKDKMSASAAQSASEGAAQV